LHIIFWIFFFSVHRAYIPIQVFIIVYVKYIFIKNIIKIMPGPYMEPSPFFLYPELAGARKPWCGSATLILAITVKKYGAYAKMLQVGNTALHFTTKYHRYLIPRLSLKVVYLWHHVSSTAPPFILWWWNLETLFAPLNRSSPFIAELRCQAIQMEHALI
jgi:hypothetical protein